MSAAIKYQAESLAADFTRTCAVLDGTRTLALLVGADGTILNLNQPLADILGAAADVLKGTPFWTLLPPDRRDAVRSLLEQVAQERCSCREDANYGGRWYDCRWTPKLNPESGVIGIFMLGWDVTEHQQRLVGSADGITERNQPAGTPGHSQKRLDLFFNQSLDGFYFSELDEPVVWNDATNKDAALGYIAAHQRITEANDAMLALYGASRETFRGRLVSSFFRHDSVKGRQFQRQLFDQGRIRVESCERTDSGAEVWIEGDYICIYDEQRRIVGTFGTQRDITARKQSEAALSSSQRRFTTIFQACPIAAGISRLDTGQFTEVNEAFLTLFGYSREEVLGHSAAELGLWPHPGEWSQLPSLLRDGGRVPQIEAKFRGKSGDTGDLLISAATIELNGERALLSMLLNVSERKELEERLRQSQKMEGIGHLAGGLAHEFNNILGALMMQLDLARDSSQPEATELLKESGGLCQRAADLISKLLAFSRKSRMKKQPLDLREIVARHCKTLAPLLGERISVNLSLPEGLPQVSADAVMMDQVLMNLCLNARDAMRGGGTIQIRLRELEFRPEQVRGREGAQPGRFVCLSVADTGCGMDGQTISRLFEPFFTTKTVGQGTGLGLAMVQGIVQQHQGWVEVESQIGQGSTFHVYLPVTTDQPPPRPPAAPVPKPPEGSFTILLVEDDAVIRKVTRRLLEKTGYTVLEAANGSEALGIWRERRIAIDLVYTDMVMPGDVSGLALANQVQADKPSVRVIITSGYHSDGLSPLEKKESSIIYLPKPCAVSTLISVIHECLHPTAV